MRQRLVAGNWKMNGSKESVRELTESIVKGLGDVTAEVVLLAPSLFIPYLEDVLKDSRIAFGGQDLNEHQEGAFTGETSPCMLKEFSCRYVLAGHSERRTLYKESNERVAKKYQAALAVGLTPILCVGETLEQREAGETEAVVQAQLQAVIDLAGAESFKNAIIAYEPVWAIGTGKTASPEQAQDIHAFIRNLLSDCDETLAERVQILYGGSVKPGNAAELFAKPDIDGGLIGGASLKANDFLEIIKA